MSSVFSWFQKHGAVLVALAFCTGLACAAEINPTPAHALFTSSAHAKLSQSVQAFPVSLSVTPNNYAARAKAIDRSKLTVKATFSDGSVRTLGQNDYTLSPNAFNAGFKGTLAVTASYTNTRKTVTSNFSLTANEAYGAQYGNTLVFGRGIPADTYSSKSLTNTTWDIEAASCSPKWNKSALASIVDIDKVKPRSITNWFNDSATIQTIALEQMDTSALTTLRGVFANDTAVKSIDVSGWNTSSVTNMGTVFQNCEELTTLKGLAGWNTANVTALDGTFLCCKKMTGFEVSGWNTSKVENLQWTFSECAALKSLDLSRWNTGKVTNMRSFCNMQEGGSALTTVGDISGWNTSNVTDMRWVFFACGALQSVNIGPWNVSKVTSFRSMFNMDYAGGGALTSVGDISKWNTSSATEFYSMFYYCTKLNANCSSWNVSKDTDHTRFNGYAPGVVAPRW